MRVHLLLLLFVLIAQSAHAEEFNAGIVQGLWYSKEAIFANEPVRVYAAIRNNTGSDLTGTIEFYDGEKRIGRSSVQALDGRIIESWADWTPAYGTHTLHANLSRIELHRVGSSTQRVTVTSSLAEDVFFVDYDTDRDGIGNERDDDDDGDGVSDEAEKQNGTDPLKKDATVDATKNSAEDDDRTTRASREQESAANTHTSFDEPRGLERYLAESPAENTLASVTHLIADAKENLDAYREKRAKQGGTETSTSTSVQNDGFGEVTRSTETGNKTVAQLSITNFIIILVDFIQTVSNIAYTAALAALSFVLGHPSLVQLAILLSVLLAVFKFASKFGKRPKKFT